METTPKHFIRQTPLTDMIELKRAHIIDDDNSSPLRRRLAWRVTPDDPQDDWQNESVRFTATGHRDRIEMSFKEAKERREAVFVPFITAGFPSQEGETTTVNANDLSFTTRNPMVRATLSYPNHSTLNYQILPTSS